MIEKRIYSRSTEGRKVVKNTLFDIPDVPFGLGHCCYKLYYGDRYIINYGENLAGSLYWLQNGFAYHVAYKQGEADEKKNKLWMKFYKYIQAHSGLKFRLEVLLKSKSAYQVLKRCQIELNAALHDKKCLNSELFPYIPKYNKETKRNGWIPLRDIILFRKFQNSIGIQSQ